NAYQDETKAPRPGLVLLDINMPKMNGIEVVKRIKEDESLRRIPVIMLTVSRREEDIIKSYNFGCNSFLQKPVDFDNFVSLVKEIGLYWGIHNVPFPV
ncbi:MAG: response regulator, partial [Candidatus Firestonebacteria bacterium]|nr:response regulator [Candidatus Firestonebacteria bacterium]